MSKSKLFYEEVNVGDQIPELGPLTWNTTDIIRFSSAVENYEPLHQARDWARSKGYKDTLINGPIRTSMLHNMLINWIGDDGFLKKLSCQQRAMDHPGYTLIAKGSVVNRFIGEDGLGYIECDIHIENQEGIITAPGKATVVLPTNENPNVPESFELPKSLN